MKNRIQKLQKFLRKKKLDSVLITNPADLIYFSGFIPLDVSEREAYVLITQKNAYILTSKLYSDDVRAYVKECILKEISSSSSSRQIILEILKKEGLKKIGFDEHTLTYAEYLSFTKENLPLVPMQISHLRTIKEHEEIENIARSCSIGDKAFDFILGKIKPGVTEENLGFELEIYMRKHYAVPSFPTIVAFGKNAATPHHVTGKEKLSENNFVLLDFGAKVNNYCSDMTRTVFLGKPTERERKIYNAVLEAQEYAIEYIQNRYAQNKSEIKASEVDKIARNHIVEQGFPSFPHSLGHGIGLKVHEAPSIFPKSYDILNKGMVFSIEPGIYLENDLGVRIEDLLALEKEEVIFLTKSPKKLITI